MTTLVTRDYNLILEALDAWLSRDSLMSFNSMLVGVMLAEDKEQKDELLAKKKEEWEKKSEEFRVKEERVTLLKAKIIALRDTNAIEDLIGG